MLVFGSVTIQKKRLWNLSWSLFLFCMKNKLHCIALHCILWFSLQKNAALTSHLLHTLLGSDQHPPLGNPKTINQQKTFHQQLFFQVGNPSHPKLGTYPNPPVHFNTQFFVSTQNSLILNNKALQLDLEYLKSP